MAIDPPPRSFFLLSLSPDLPSVFDVPPFQSNRVGTIYFRHYIATANNVIIILIVGGGSRGTHIFGTRRGMAAPHGLFSDALPSISSGEQGPRCGFGHYMQRIAIASSSA
jgi:hypothetical protein